MVPAVRVSYAGQVKSRLTQPPTARFAHERAILDNWKEDDGVYVTLRGAFAPVSTAANGPGAAVAEVDSRQSPASLPPPTPR